MENDSIRASGINTLIDIWVDGKIRAISISRAAIETFLGSQAPPAMTDEDRCEFVRNHLPQVVAAVQARLRSHDPGAAVVVIDAGQLGGTADRRRGERRNGDRRKEKKPAANLPQGERRRGDRRKGDRRK